MLQLTLMMWDENILYTLNGLAGRSPLGDGLVVFAATYLPFIVVGAFALYLYQHRMPFRQKIFTFSLAVGAALIARIGVGSTIRFFLPRARPFLSYQLDQLIREHSPSFPSGHALFFFAFSTVVYAYDRKLGAVSFLASVLICLARVAAGIHYPSDVLAGAVLGTLVGWICVRVAQAQHLLR